MISFQEYRTLQEGGNVQIGDQSAERIDLSKISRDDITPEIEKVLDAFNQAFEAEHNIPIWTGELFKSKKFLSGSAFHFFDKAIATADFKQFKNTVGDIDTQVDSAFEGQVEAFLTASAGKSFGPAKLIGHKNSAGQSISLWEFPAFKINVQIDLEYVDFANGEPTAWSQFSHSSDWDDLKAGIKGVAHKYAIRALTSKTLRDIIILKGKKETPTQVKATDLAFSVTQGLRVKLEPVMDGDTHRHQDGLQVYREIATKASNYVTDLAVMFEILFDHKPSDKELKQFNSYIGCLELVKRFFSERQQDTFVLGFAHTLWGPGAQGLYRGDAERDLHDKMIAYSRAIQVLGQDQHSAAAVELLRSNYYKTYR
jgi:hypothetical protein